MDLTQLFAAAAAIAIATTIVVATSDAKRVVMLVLFSVPQLYLVSIGGVYVSAGVGMAAILLPTALMRLRVHRLPAARLIGVLLLAEIASMFWSSDLRLAERTVLYQLPFFVTLCIAYTAIRSHPRALVNATKGFAVLAACEAVLVIYSRVSPAAEHRFLTSGLARLFVNPNSLGAILTISPDNVLDPSKAGGIFTNANVAAAFLGISAFVVAGVALTERCGWLRGVALLTWLAVFFTGSGVGALLAISLPAVMWAISTRRGRAHHSGRIVVLLSIAVPIVVLEVLGRLHIAGDKAASASSRLLIWKFAAREFERTPILGQGFGGWQRTFPAYADGRDLLATFPPHNSLIYMWSQAGLIAAASGIAVLVWIGRALRRSYRADPASRPLVAATGVALTWLFLHSFFENYGLLGDEHMQPILALAVAMCLATARHLGVTETPMDGSHGTQSHRVPEPAVSAV